MVKLIEFIKYWSQAFLLPLYGLSYLSPRDKRLWVFGSTFGRRFSENPRYLYLYVAQNRPSIRPVWISHNKSIVSFLNQNGYESYYYHSLKGIYTALRAGVYIFDNYSKDINFWQSGGAVKVNLWHGSGNKKTNHDNEFDKIRHPKNAYERWKTFLRRISDEKPTDYTLATSEAMAEIFTSAFATDLDHIILEGYPRNDTLFRDNIINNLTMPVEQKLLSKIADFRKEHIDCKVLTYLPTFRESESLFFDACCLDELDEYLCKNNYLLIAKLHPKSRIKEAFQSVDGKNIINADPEIDVYSFLSECDVLITDYSSVYTDFMLTNRPVVAFDYDWEEYSRDTRSCYIDQDEYMPEIKATDTKSLMAAIDEAIANDPCKEKRLISRERMFKYTDGNASKRLCDKIQTIAKLK